MPDTFGSDDPRLSDARPPLTHVHAQSDVTGLVSALSGKQDTSARGQANGYAGLAADGKVPSAQLPASQGGGTTLLFNAAVADVVATAADTYLTGSSLAIGGKLKAGTLLHWRAVMTKTAAGIATPIVSVRFGTNGSTGDTARVTFTGSAQTSVVDAGWFDLTLTVRTFSATGIVQAALNFGHNLQTTGLANRQQQVYQAVSSTFDLTPAGLIAGLSVNPGASGVWTFQLVEGEAVNLA